MSKNITEGSILFIDDEKNTREIYKEFLELEGYRVTTCSNGLEAIVQLIKDPFFDLIITDLNMPVMDGEQFIRIAHPLYEQIPIIATTGMPDLEIEQKKITNAAMVMRAASDTISFGAEEVREKITVVGKNQSSKEKREDFLKKICKLIACYKRPGQFPYEHEQNLLLVSSDTDFAKYVSSSLAVKGLNILNAQDMPLLEEIVQDAKLIQTAIIDQTYSGLRKFSMNNLLNGTASIYLLLARRFGTKLSPIIFGRGNLSKRLFSSEQLYESVLEKTLDFYEGMPQPLKLNSINFSIDNYNPDALIWFFCGIGAGGKSHTSFLVRNMLNKAALETNKERCLKTAVAQLYTTRGYRDKERKIISMFNDLAYTDHLDRLSVTEDEFCKLKREEDIIYDFSSQRYNDPRIRYGIPNIFALTKQGYKVIINLTTKKAYDSFRDEYKNELEKAGCNAVLFFATMDEARLRYHERDRLGSMHPKISPLDEIRDWAWEIEKSAMTVINNWPYGLSPENRSINQDIFEQLKLLSANDRAYTIAALMGGDINELKKQILADNPIHYKIQGPILPRRDL